MPIGLDWRLAALSSRDDGAEGEKPRGRPKGFGGGAVGRKKATVAGGNVQPPPQQTVTVSAKRPNPVGWMMDDVTICPCT